MDNLNSMESSNSNPICYRNHLPWPSAEKDALASYSNSSLPLSTPPVLHIPVFDYTLAYTGLKLIAVNVVSLISTLGSYTEPFLIPTGFL